MLHRIRLAGRAVVRRPGTSLVIVLTLALAMGAATIVVSTIDLIWHIVPIADRSRFVLVASTDTRQVGAAAATVLRSNVSIPDLVDWSAATSFEAMTALTLDTATLSGVDTPIGVSLARVTTNLPEVWGFAPSLGRSFRSDEGTPSARGAVALLTQRVWERTFASSPSVLGRTVRLNGTPHTIVGILPPTASTGVLQGVDVFVPLDLDASRASRDDRSLRVIARLRPGIDRAAAAAELTTIASRLQREYPASNARIGVVVDPIIEASGMSVRLLLVILGLIAALILAMACANVANMLFAQNVARQEESAIRAALGGSRRDRLWQLLTEHTMLSALACIVGVTLAASGVGLLRGLAGDAFGFRDLALNWRVLAATAATALLAPLVFGTMPALRSATVDGNWLRSSRGLSGSRRTFGTQRLLVAVQAGLAVVLTIQVALLSLSAWRLSRIDNGFDPDGVLTFHLALPELWNAEPAKSARFVSDALREIERLPGVSSAATIGELPVVDDEVIGTLVIDGMPMPSAGEPQPVSARTGISARYFETMRIPLLRGRTFTETDVQSGARLAVVSAETARRYFASREVIGSRIALGPVSTPDDWFTIVGIAGNVRNSDVDQGAIPEVYVPSAPRAGQRLAVVVRSVGPDPASFVPAIRTLVGALDGDQALLDVASMRQVIADDLIGTTVLVAILATIGLVAVCLAASGTYAVTAFAVGQRTREIGLRMALGANPAATVRLFVRQTAIPLGLGGLTGLILAFALAQQITESQVDATFRDPMPYAAVVALLSTVALVASYAPARRASRIDPAVALRSE